MRKFAAFVKLAVCRLRSEFPELEKVCWNGKKLWTPGYYAGTTGGAGIDTVRRYIEQQDTPA